MGGMNSSGIRVSDRALDARVIQKNGGVLGSESYSPRSGRITQRYWIEL